MIKDKINMKDFARNTYKMRKINKFIDEEVDNKQWAKTIWAAKNVNKHSFTSWMAVHNRLKTRSRLKWMRIMDNENRTLCVM